jgi:acid phosphatase (class A)
MGKPILGMNPPDFITGAKYPVASWRPDFFAMLGIAEFAKLNWQDRIVSTAPKPFTDPSEERDLLKLQTYDADRAERFAEILDQDERLNVYFAHTLMLSPTAHPHTLRVIEMTYQIGLMIAVHFKDKWNRARPQQVCPAIMPIIPGPAHPSYPSGHSTQSHLIANALSLVAPRVGPLLKKLAERIAKNREIAGVHFASDSAEGETLAAQAITLLTDRKLCPIFMRELDAAKAEQ